MHVVVTIANFHRVTASQATHTKTTWKGRDDAKRFMRAANRRTRKNLKEEAALQRIIGTLHIQKVILLKSFCFKKLLSMRSICRIVFTQSTPPHRCRRFCQTDICCGGTYIIIYWLYRRTGQSSSPTFIQFNAGQRSMPRKVVSILYIFVICRIAINGA